MEDKVSSFLEVPHQWQMQKLCLNKIFLEVSRHMMKDNQELKSQKMLLILRISKTNMKWLKLEAKVHFLENLNFKDLQKEILMFYQEPCKAMIKVKIQQDLDRQNHKKNDEKIIII